MAASDLVGRGTIGGSPSIAHTRKTFTVGLESRQCLFPAGWLSWQRPAGSTASQQQRPRDSRRRAGQQSPPAGDPASLMRGARCCTFASVSTASALSRAVSGVQGAPCEPMVRRPSRPSARARSCGQVCILGGAGPSAQRNAKAQTPHV